MNVQGTNGRGDFDVFSFGRRGLVYMRTRVLASSTESLLSGEEATGTG